MYTGEGFAYWGKRRDLGMLAVYGAYFRDLDGNKLCVFTYENGGPAQT